MSLENKQSNIVGNEEFSEKFSMKLEDLPWEKTLYI